MFYSLFKSSAKLFVRNFINAFFCIIFPPVMIILFGSIYGNEPDSIYGGYGMVDVSIAAYVALIISVTAFMGIPMELSNFREKKILKKYMVTPVKQELFLCSEVLVNAIATIIGIIVLFIIGKFVYSVKFQGNIFLFIAVFLLSLFSMFTIGLLLSNIGKNIKNTNTLCYSVFFPMLFLSGATIPIELFPESVKMISKIIPLTYVVDMLKASWLGKDIETFYIDIVITGLVLVIGVVLNIKLFKWTV